jgi:hypothetical protein
MRSRSLGAGRPTFSFRTAHDQAPVVVGKKTAKDLVRGVEIGSTGQTQLAGEAILKGTPEAFRCGPSARAIAEQREVPGHPNSSPLHEPFLRRFHPDRTRDKAARCPTRMLEEVGVPPTQRSDVQ